MPSARHSGVTRSRLLGASPASFQRCQSVHRLGEDRLREQDPLSREIDPVMHLPAHFEVGERGNSVN